MRGVRVLSVLLAVALVATTSGAQVCQPDPGAVGSLSPAPWLPPPGASVYNLETVCISLPYEQTITVNVPSTLPVDEGSVTVESLSFATSGAIANLPSGMQYACNPANCVFAPNTPGCIRLSGTPNASNFAPATVDLVTTAQLKPSGGDPFQVSFPKILVTSSHYYVLVRSAAICMGPDTSSTTTTTSPTGTTLTTGTVTTTVPGGPTLTTTTQPVDCSLVPIRDTYRSLACELVALREDVGAEPSLVEIIDRLRAPLVKAAAHEQRSADVCSKARTGKARKSLRRAVAPLKQFARRLRSRAARDVPEAVRERLTRASETLQANLKSLAARLACPDDADAG